VSFSHARTHVFAIGTEDGSVYVWDMSNHTDPIVSFQQVHMAAIRDIVFSPFNRNHICTVGLDKQLVLYDIVRKKWAPFCFANRFSSFLTFKRVIQTFATENPLTCCAYNREGDTLYIGTLQGKILIFDFQTQEWSHSVWAHEPHPVHCIKFQVMSTK
jgi:WD40 repeat protein